MLTFSDESSFDNYLSYMFDSGLDLDTWEADLGFQSARSHYLATHGMEAELPKYLYNTLLF